MMQRFPDSSMHIANNIPLSNFNQILIFKKSVTTELNLWLMVQGQDFTQTRKLPKIKEFHLM